MRKSGRILVADDEKPQREILVSSLEKRGYEVCGAGDLSTALNLFEQGLQNQNPFNTVVTCLLYTSPSPRDLSTSRMPSSA